jgi:DNA-binding MarR family transcriptional regulator
MTTDSARPGQVDLRQLFDDLVRFETELWNELDARLRREADLPLGSFDVLQVLGRVPDCRVNDVAAALAITVGGASQAVDRLERRGLCARRPHPQDRRATIVGLTDEGRAISEAAGRVFDRELAARFDGALSKSALRHLADALATLRGGAPHRPAARQ